MVQAAPQDKPHRQNDAETVYQQAVAAIRAVPPAMIPRLLQEIADHMTQPIGNAAHQQTSTHAEVATLPQPDRGRLEDALGLLATDEPAPTDKEVRQVVFEYLKEKYG